MSSVEKNVTDICKAVNTHLVQDETRRTALDGWSKVFIAIGPALAAAVMWWIAHYGTVSAVAATGTK